MPARGQSKNKRKHEEIKRDLLIILHTATWITLDMDIYSACEVCTPKLQRKRGMGRNIKLTKNNFRITSKTKRC